MSRIERATPRQRRQIQQAVRRYSCCTLAPSSAANQPPVAGVLYAAVDRVLDVSSLRSSANVRNITVNQRVALCMPVRRYPIGPSFSLHLQGNAEIRSVDDPEISKHHRAGRLKRITSHGEMEDPDAA
jgi:Pyridoxamine 5'-phosphate oxidase